MNDKNDAANDRKEELNVLENVLSETGASETEMRKSVPMPDSQIRILHAKLICLRVVFPGKALPYENCGGEAKRK